MKVNIIIIKIYNNIEKCVDTSLLLIFKQQIIFYDFYLNIVFI